MDVSHRLANTNFRIKISGFLEIKISEFQRCVSEFQRCVRAMNVIVLVVGDDDSHKRFFARQAIRSDTLMQLAPTSMAHLHIGTCLSGSYPGRWQFAPMLIKIPQPKSHKEVGCFMIAILSQYFDGVRPPKPHGRSDEANVSRHGKPHVKQDEATMTGRPKPKCYGNTILIATK